VYIGENTVIKNSIIGPYVSLGRDSQVSDSRIRESLIQNEVSLKGVNLINSMIGNHVKMEATPDDISLGDFSEWKK
ncbi:MAG: nucleotidyltransferase, partial [Marinoscillum sp.]